MKVLYPKGPRAAVDTDVYIYIYVARYTYIQLYTILTLGLKVCT